MAQYVTNANEVLRSSKATKEQVTKAMYYANRKTADAAQAYVRRYIPPPKGSSLFPGYAATGALSNAVSVAGPMPITGGVKSDIFMAQDRTRVYQRIHEYGGIIKARNKPYLVFMIMGRWVRVKQVRIRPKRYWYHGWRYGMQRFHLVFDKYMKAGLKL